MSSLILCLRIGYLLLGCIPSSFCFLEKSVVFTVHWLGTLILGITENEGTIVWKKICALLKVFIIFDFMSIAHQWTFSGVRCTLHHHRAKVNLWFAEGEDISSISVVYSCTDVISQLDKCRLGAMSFPITRLIGVKQLALFKIIINLIMNKPLKNLGLEA